MSKMKLSCHDQSDRVWFVMKTRHDNDTTNHTGVIYAQNDTKLLWSIESSVVCEEN